MEWTESKAHQMHSVSICNEATKQTNRETHTRASHSMSFEWICRIDGHTTKCVPTSGATSNNIPSLFFLSPHSRPILCSSSLITVNNFGNHSNLRSKKIYDSRSYIFINDFYLVYSHRREFQQKSYPLSATRHADNGHDDGDDAHNDKNLFTIQIFSVNRILDTKENVH